MRAPGSSDSGWHEPSGFAIVKRMSANRPRARRSRMCRSVAVVRLGRARRRPRRGRAPPPAWPELGRGHAKSARGRAVGSTRTAAPRCCATRTCPIPIAGEGEVLVALRAAVAQPPRRLDPQGPAVGAEAAHPRRRRRGRRETRPGAIRFDPGAGRRDQPGRRARGERISVIGEHCDGTHAELVAVPGANVYPHPRRISFEAGRRVPARVRDRLPDARHARAAAARASGCCSGASAAASRRRPRDRAGARRAHGRHVVAATRSSPARGSSARRDGQPRDRRRRRAR